MSAYPLWLNAVLFLPAAGIIWWAGVRLERYADVISHRTGLGQAFTGMLLLAAATSLPEVATTVTAIVVLENPSLAVHNLLGGVALQTAMLVVADRMKRRPGALTFFSPRFVLLIQGVGLLFLLQIAAAGIIARGTPAVFSVSLWLVALLAAYVGVLYLSYQHRGQPRWTPSRTDDLPRELAAGQDGDAERDQARTPEEEDTDRRPLWGIWLRFAGASALVLVGGWFATRTAETLAEQTGLGSAFVGATLLALATSLPELSTTVAATRSGRYPVAIANVFGSNAFDVALLFVAEVLYRRDSILRQVEPTVVFVGTVGSAMTCLYLWGLMERGNRTVFGIGWDSAAAAAVYAGGMAVLYLLG